MGTMHATRAHSHPAICLDAHDVRTVLLWLRGLCAQPERAAAVLRALTAHGDADLEQVCALADITLEMDYAQAEGISETLHAHALDAVRWRPA